MTAPRRLQLRRGNTAATSTYVGAPGELVVNTTTNTLYLHDGSTVGGYATTSNITAINNQISSVNANITLANTGMRGYVDATIAANIANIAVAATYSNVNVKAYTESMGYQNFGNVNVAAYVTTANSAIIGYIDLANTIQSAQVNAANLAITAANLGMKGYVDSVASQSIYGNGNVKSYLTQFNGNIVPSANVTYSLGNVTNRWKDLYLSGNTIYLGDATITTEGSRLVTTGVAISPPTGAVGFANVYYESPTDFAQIRSYYVDNNFGYTANLKSWATAPIVWDSLRSAKIYHAGSEFPAFDPLDTVGGRYANAVCTLDSTGNIASLTITDGGIGYDAYYPYYATDPTGYVYNSIGRSDEGAPQGIGFRRINLVPTTASDIGNVPYLIRTGGSGGPTIERGPAAPTVGSNTYTWTGNSGSTFSITIDWTANTSTSFSYTPALPPLTSAQEWQDWLLDYQAAYAGPTPDPLYPDYSPYAYLLMEALPSILIYDITNAIWFLNVENPTFWQTLPGLPVNLSDNYFRVMLGRTAIGVATLESGYGVPVYWSRGLSADTGISSGGDMTVAGDLRVTGDLYVSPTSIYMGDLRISAADGNLKVNTGIKFSDDSVQSTAYSNVKVAAYLTANPPAGTYSNVQVGVFTNLSNYAYNANVTAANIGVVGYIDLANTIQSNQISAANVGMKGYVDNQITTITGSAPAILDTLGELANALGADANLSVTITSQIANVNANITTANLGMRGYVDSQSFYSNAKVATYLPTYSGNISANISKAGYTWTFGADGTTSFPNSLILAPASQSITMQSDQYSQLMWENANLTVAPNMAINSNFYVAQNNATLDIGYRDGSSTQLIKSWYWNVDGNLKLPSGGYILNSDDSIYGGGNYSNVQVATYLPTYSGNIGNISFSDADHVGGLTHTIKGHLSYISLNAPDNTRLASVGGNVEIQAGSPQWRYDTFGNLTLPSNIAAINYANGVSILSGLGGSSYSNVQVATYLPTYSGVVTASNVAVAGNVTAIRFFGDGGTLSNVTFNVAGNITGTSANVTLQAGAYTSVFDNQGNVTVPRLFTAGNIQTAGYLFGNGALLTGIVAGSSYSNVQVETYLPTYAGTVSASLVNTSGNILSSGLSVFGNTRIGLAGVVSGQFHSVVGNITQTSSGGAVYINTTGNVLAAAVVAGAVTSTGTVAVNAATGITTNQATFLLANASATTINMGGAAATIRMGTITSNVFVGSAIGNSNKELTLRAQGTWNIATSIDSNGGFNSPPYTNQLVIGGSGTGMTANYSASGGYLTTLTIYNPGTGYRNGDVLSVPGGIAGNTFTLTNYSSTLTGNSAAAYTFGIEGNLTVPGNVTARNFIGSGALLTTLPGYAYGNVNVAAYLNATGYNLYSNVNVANYLTTATITTTGNVTAGNLITGGALYVANITTTGASGNISGANYITANVILTNGGWGNISQVALITANVVTATSYIKVTPTTVANLISASTAGAGARDFVTDANTITFGSVVGGSGANIMPVFSNGTSWLIG